MPWIVIPQELKIGKLSMTVDAKPVRFAKNTEGKMDDDGNVPEFIQIPTVAIVLFKNDSWNGPVNVDPDNLQGVLKLVYCRRADSFTLHYPHREDRDYRTGATKLEAVKTKGMSASAMLRTLSENRIPSDFAAYIVNAAWVAGQKKKKEKKAA